MNIMELGAIGELVGGIAVIGSLLYVGVQIRLSTRQAGVDAARDVATQFDRYLATIATDPKVREMWIVATAAPQIAPMRNPAGLNSDDLAEFCLVLYRAFHQFASQYRARQTGTLDDQQWAKIIPWLHMHLGTEPALDWWQWARTGWFDADFTAFVEAEIHQLATREA